MTTPALIGYHNVLAEETISASTEESGFEKENAYDGFVFDYWKPTAIPAWLKATGKMPVGMWLGDTIEESLVGSDLAVNGDFVSDITSWTGQRGDETLSWDAGLIKIVNGAGGYGGAYQAVTLVVGQTYIVTGEYTHTDGTGFLIISSNTAGSLDRQIPVSVLSATGSWEYTFVATISSAYISFSQGSTSTPGTISHFDNITLRIAVPDLSVNNKGLGIYGSITKSAVNTGAELMAYSGFANSANYILQPHNPDYDFGTGDFAIAFWFSADESPSTKYIFERSDTGYTGSRISVLRHSADRIRFELFDGVTIINHQSPLGYMDEKWHLVYCVKRGNDMEIHIDGVNVVTGDITSIGNLDNSTAITAVGSAVSTNGQYNDDYLSLVRVFDYAPTAAQILDIYNKEKHYFKTGGTLPETLISTSATTADYFAMYAHDFAQSGSSVVLQYSDDDSAWTDAFTPIYPATSAPIFKTFPQSSHKYWRVYVDGAVQQIGVAMFGVALEMQRGLGAGFEPMSLGSENTPITTESSDGSFLGRSTKKRPIKVRLVFKNLTPAWVREYWPELLENLESEPFMALPSPDTYPDEAAFCWTDGPVKTPRYNGSNLIDLSVPLKARIK